MRTAARTTRRCGRDEPAGHRHHHPRSWSKERMAIAACGACHTQSIRSVRLRGLGRGRLPGGARTSKPATRSPEPTWPDRFNGPAELGRQARGKPPGAACVATQWFRFANGRMEDTTRDACSLNSLKCRLPGFQGRPEAAAGGPDPDRRLPSPQQRRRSVKKKSSPLTARTRSASAGGPCCAGPAASPWACRSWS